VYTPPAPVAKAPTTSTGHHNNEMNDLTATAVSNIQLNLTDDLMTQVDYCLNEVSDFSFSQRIFFINLCIRKSHFCMKLMTKISGSN
jgi:hypothetical protein